MKRTKATLMVLIFAISSMTGLASAEESSDSEQWPGEPFDSHIHLTWATLTLDVNDWADEYPEIVDLTSAGTSELGKTLWVVRLSDWSNETKEDGSPKEMVYIDGGHHGNEYLGTALAYLSAKWYINEWAAGNQEAINVLRNTELHILIMLNPDGNDIDTRWNINQVDLNRNYDHYWNTCDSTQPGSSAFSESETRANADYMNEYMVDADLYVTMHTGVWIMLYPWGKWPDQPSDWELFHQIRTDVQANVSEIPIQNANQGLYPNCGTSRDYGYGQMGFPTFTFETDDEQFVPGSFENLNQRLGEEMDVMRYLINNVWYWRARLDVQSLEYSNEAVEIEIQNLGQASTANATLQYISSNGEIEWTSDLFGVNASNSTSLTFDLSQTLSQDGEWRLNYAKRVIQSAQWVNESINGSVIENLDENSKAMPGFALFNPLAIITGIALVAIWKRDELSEN